LDVDDKKLAVTKAAQEFYEKYYTPDRMTLILVGVDSLDYLENLAIKNFGLFQRRYNSLP